MIYLDHAASTPIADEALALLNQSLKDDFANPSAAYSLGTELGRRLEQARSFFLQCLQAQDQYQFIFTSSATESNNMVLQGMAVGKPLEICFSQSEHPSIVSPSLAMTQENPAFIRTTPLTESGTVDAYSLMSALTETTRILCLTHVNNQSGSLTDVMKVAKTIKGRFPKLHIHVDASQSFTKTDLDLREGWIDSLTISAHKMGGPRGVSGLYVKSKIQLKPLLFGGGQEMERRSSTVSTSLALAWQKATELRLEKSREFYFHVRTLNQSLRRELKSNNTDLIFPFELDSTSPYILCLIVPGISSDILLRHLEEKQIFVSSTSACSSRIRGKNSTFEALGIPERFHKNVLRISFSPFTRDEEVQAFAKEFSKTYQELKSLLV